MANTNNTVMYVVKFYILYCITVLFLSLENLNSWTPLKIRIILFAQIQQINQIKNFNYYTMHNITEGGFLVYSYGLIIMKQLQQRPTILIRIISGYYWALSLEVIILNVEVASRIYLLT